MVITKLVPVPTHDPFRDPTLEQPTELVRGERLGSAHGVILELGVGDKRGTPKVLRITQYRVSDFNWAFRVEEIDPAFDV